MGQELEPGDLVVEAGIRQAWPFLTFAKPNGMELRLYVDAPVQVLPWLPQWTQQDRDEVRAAFAELNGLTITVVSLDANRALNVQFEANTALRISGQANKLTTGDVWWLAAMDADAN